MKFVGMTKRWFLNVGLIMVIILASASAIFFFALESYYYGAVGATLDSYSADVVASSLNFYGGTVPGSFLKAGRKFIENFPDKDVMAVWLIDGAGKAALSSSGFEIKEEIDAPDYVAALNGGDKSAKWIGRLPSGEKIMASTVIYNYPNGSFAGAVRFMISLEAISGRLAKILFIVIAICLAVFSPPLVSGIIFIRSIANPVKDIGETARKIAGGDFEARIGEYPYNDEIGDLCAAINDMAEKLAVSDRMKNDFISTVSHELRTPLTAIKGWGETLLQLGDSDPKTAERGTKVIIGEASRLNDMVEELLDFSRMSSNRMKLNNEKIDVLGELDDAVFSFRERAIKEGIELAYNVPHVPAPANGDAARIRQVFINILDNALKYSEHGGKITVCAEIINPATIIISVSDKGAGIAPRDLPHVKEKFYKANATVRGSGIGLAVADEIIKLHHGELEIDSVLGEGTTVRITLPIEPAERSDLETEGEKEKP